MMPFYNLDPSSDGEKIAQQLERLDDYRVLRRLPRLEEMWCRSMPVPTNVLRLAILDCETNGLDPERYRMIELAIGTLSIDAEHGDVVDVTAPVSWLEDPGETLPIEIERLTGITDQMLLGETFPEAEIERAMAGVDVVIAHNAKFDRAFVTRRFPGFDALPWACSMSEVDWLALGWTSGRGIGALLAGAGFFLPDAHRAAADVWATTCLLASQAPDGRAIATHLIEIASRHTHRLYATRAPFRLKDALKAAGYRWSSERRAWWIEADPERVANEEVWLRQLSSTILPEVEEITWRERFQAGR